MYNGNFSSLDPEHNNLSHSDWIFNTIREKEKVSSVKCRLHASTTIIMTLIISAGQQFILCIHAYSIYLENMYMYILTHTYILFKHNIFY